MTLCSKVAGYARILSVLMRGLGGLHLELLYTLLLCPEAFFYQLVFVLSEDPLSYSCSVLPLGGQPPRSRVVEEQVNSASG